MMKSICWRGGVALCLASALLMTNLGCQPGGGSGATSGTNKASSQKQDDKGKPGGHHEHDPG